MSHIEMETLMNSRPIEQLNSNHKHNLGQIKHIELIEGSSSPNFDEFIPPSTDPLLESTPIFPQDPHAHSYPYPTHTQQYQPWNNENNHMYYNNNITSSMIRMQLDQPRFTFPPGFPRHLATPPPELPDHPLLNGAFRRNSSLDSIKMMSVGSPTRLLPTLSLNNNTLVDIQGVNVEQKSQPTSISSMQLNNKSDILKVQESPNESDPRSLNDSRNGKKRSSRYRGVTKHRRSGRWEAHIWVKELGRQVYLGGYENEDHAAEAYDVAAIKCKGAIVKTNFDIDKYTDLIKCMDNISLDELIMAVRRQSQGFARGTSSYRGVTYHPSGRWESRIGIPGSKHIYLGLFEEEAEAARAYDRSLVRLRGSSAATNFALSDYRLELADYHKMQQLVLMGPDVEKVLGTGPEFERWIKNGYKNTKNGDQNGSFSNGQVQSEQQEQPHVLPFMELDTELVQPNKRFKTEVVEQVGESNGGGGIQPNRIEFLQASDLQIEGIEDEFARIHSDIDAPLAKLLNLSKNVLNIEVDNGQD